MQGIFANPDILLLSDFQVIVLTPQACLPHKTVLPFHILLEPLLLFCPKNPDNYPTLQRLQSHSQNPRRLLTYLLLHIAVLESLFHAQPHPYNPLILQRHELPLCNHPLQAILPPLHMQFYLLILLSYPLLFALHPHMNLTFQIQQLPLRNLRFLSYLLRLYIVQLESLSYDLQHPYILQVQQTAVSHPYNSLFYTAVLHFYKRFVL